MSRPISSLSQLPRLAWACCVVATLPCSPVAAQPAGPDSIIAVTQSADSLRLAGDLPRARVLLLGLPESALSRPRPDTAAAARAELLLARIERDLNNAAAARGHDERGIALLDPDGRPAPAVYRSLLQDLTSVLRTLGQYDLALKNAQRLLEIRRATAGLSQVEISASLASVASVMADLGRFDEATPQLEEAYALSKATSGADDPSTLGRLINLGNLAAARDDYVAAESLYSKVVAGRLRTYGPKHLGVAEALYDLALAHHVLGRDSLALCEGEQAAAIRRDAWRATIPFLPEQAALQLINEYWRGHEVALDAALAQERPSPADLARLWHTAFELRTLVFDEVVWRQQERRAEAAAPDRQWKEWSATRGGIARLVTAGFDLKRDPAARGRLDSLRAAADSLEWRLLAGLPQLGSARRARRVTWQEIADAVPKDASLVGCFRYGRVLRETAWQRWAKDLRFQYAALVLRGDTRELKVISLGDATEIDSLIQAWVVGISDHRQERSQPELEVRRAGLAVRARIWDPIAHAIGPSSRVLLVPDGQLSLVPWEALPAGRDGYLIDDSVRVERIFSERDLVEDTRGTRASGRLLAVGGANFDRVTAPAARLDGADHLRSDEGFACLRDARASFPPLPASGVEAERLCRLWRSRGGKSTLLSGPAATVEQLVNALPGVTWVHIATHGFSLPDSCLPEYEHDQWLMEPLSRYGLVLAGANRGRSALSETASALLRGSEIALLDLNGVDEVDLSTCRSGAGIVSLSEGVFGLPRAFRVAGAQRIVCTQWPIGDEMSARWMDAYSRTRVFSGLTPNMAARRASRELLSEMRRLGQSTAPRNWASFAVWGDAE